MILVNYHTPSHPDDRLGVKTDSGIFNVGLAASDSKIGDPTCPSTIDALLVEGLAALPKLQALVNRGLKFQPKKWLEPVSAVQYAPCVPHPEKIICVGLNYRRHAAESGMAVPQTPVLFSKFNNSLAGCGEQVPLAANAEQYDYEAELVVVIGKQGRYISQADALDYVFGYCNGNDLSARDLQMRTSQWLLGKTPDKFMPLGPDLVTADQVKDPQSLPIQCWLNGELRQSSNTADMVFSVAELVSYISQFITLQPGDLISTGTPEGVILGMKEKKWLKPGDEVVIEVEGLGKLTNRMIQG